MTTSELAVGTVADFWSVTREDNVATCIREGGVTSGAMCSVSVAGEALLSLVARNAIAYGHKIALQNIDVGERVTKYGMSIGVANVPILTGDHVHVHNIESERGRGDHVQEEPDLHVHVGPWAKWRRNGGAQ